MSRGEYTVVLVLVLVRVLLETLDFMVRMGSDGSTIASLQVSSLIVRVVFCAVCTTGFVVLML